MLFIGLIIGLCLGFIPFLIKRNKIRQINNSIIEEEEQLKKSIEEKQIQIKNIDADIEMRVDAQEKLKKKLDIEHKEILKAQEQELEELKRTKTELTSRLEEEKKSIIDRFNVQLEQVAEKYQQDEEACKREYLTILEDAKTEHQLELKTLANQKAIAQEEYKKLKQAVNVATEAALREGKKKQQIDFYKLQIPEKDLKTIKKLREIETDLDDTLALNKAIWKIYYEKPYSDLVGRVIGKDCVSGIYKITNLENQMCYVGQSVDLADRWKQHLKRGIGAEPPTRNKLYPAMLATGVENFSFEVIEICPKEELNEKEKFWQNHFNAMTYGYSMR